jgi:tetratricopeptide (TPR) repeat protein
MRRAVFYTAFVLIVCVAWSARGDSTQSARVHYQEGTKRYNLAEYEKALEEFKAAYLAKPDPAFLFNIAQCHRQLNDYEAAAKSYRAFLRESADLPLAAREQVQKLAADMEQAAREARAKRQQPPSGTQAPRDETEAKPPVPVPPSPTPQAETEPVSRNTRAESETHPGRTFKIAGLALGVVGIAAIAVGGTMEGLAAQAANDLTQANRNGMPFDQSRYSTGQAEDYAGATLLAVGGAAVVVGVALGVVGIKQERASRVAFLPWMTAHAAGASLEVRR